jgi:hypothetical protein
MDGGTTGVHSRLGALLCLENKRAKKKCVCVFVLYIYYIHNCMCVCYIYLYNVLPALLWP